LCTGRTEGRHSCLVSPGTRSANLGSIQPTAETFLATSVRHCLTSLPYSWNRLRPLSLHAGYLHMKARGCHVFVMSLSNLRPLCFNSVDLEGTFCVRVRAINRQRLDSKSIPRRKAAGPILALLPALSPPGTARATKGSVITKQRLPKVHKIRVFAGQKYRAAVCPCHRRLCYVHSGSRWCAPLGSSPWPR
jgi:hypothetical protein